MADALRGKSVEDYLASTDINIADYQTQTTTKITTDSPKGSVKSGGKTKGKGKGKAKAKGKAKGKAKSTKKKKIVAHEADAEVPSPAEEEDAQLPEIPQTGDVAAGDAAQLAPDVRTPEELGDAAQLAPESAQLKSDGECADEAGALPSEKNETIVEEVHVDKAPSSAEEDTQLADTQPTGDAGGGDEAQLAPDVRTAAGDAAQLALDVRASDKTEDAAQLAPDVHTPEKTGDAAQLAPDVHTPEKSVFDLASLPRPCFASVVEAPFTSPGSSSASCSKTADEVGDQDDNDDGEALPRKLVTACLNNLRNTANGKTHNEAKRQLAAEALEIYPKLAKKQKRLFLADWDENGRGKLAESLKFAKHYQRTLKSEDSLKRTYQYAMCTRLQVLEKFKIPLDIFPSKGSNQMC